MPTDFNRHPNPYSEPVHTNNTKCQGIYVPELYEGESGLKKPEEKTNVDFSRQ